MAPVAPSPHRFLGRQPRRRPDTPPRKEQRSSLVQPSRTLHQATEDQSRDPHAAPTSQFASPPHFSVGRARAPILAQDARPSSPPRPAVLNALRTPAHPREVIDDDDDAHDARALNDSTNIDDEEMLEFGDDALPSTERRLEEAETLHYQAGETDDRTYEIPYSPKRRRLDAASETNESTTSTRPLFRRPEAPASRFPPSHSTGSIPPSTSDAISSTTNTTTAPHHNRPPFLRPPLTYISHPDSPSQFVVHPDAAVAVAPLPEAFSPHRRGQRFVPGGMAATVQSWILEVGQAAAAQRRRTYGEQFERRIVVEEIGCEGACGLMVKARAVGSEAGEGAWVLLTRQSGGGEGGGQRRVEEGATIGIRAPSWEVDVEGRRWLIAVDWKVIGG